MKDQGGGGIISGSEPLPVAMSRLTEEIRQEFLTMMFANNICSESRDQEEERAWRGGGVRWREEG